MLVAALVLLASSAGQAGLASEPPPRIAKFLEQCESLRRGAILQVEHELRGLRADGADDRETVRRIGRLEEQLRLLEANQELVVPELSFPPQIGAIGRLPGLTCHVIQVVSPQETLVRCSFPVTVVTVRDFKRYRETVTRPVELLIRGPSEPFTAGGDVEMLGVFEVTGRETYRTASGRSKSLLVLGTFDLDRLEPFRGSEGR